MIQLAASIISGCRHWWHSDGCAVMLDFICLPSLFMQFVTNSVINVLNEFGEMAVVIFHVLLTFINFLSCKMALLKYF